MMWNFGPWEMAILLSKLLGYISLASLAGGVFVLWLMGRFSPASTRPIRSIPSRFQSPSDKNIWPLEARRRIVVVLFGASILGSLSISLFFLFQIGLINQSGIAGMFDPIMINLVIKTNVGYGVALKLLGFIIAGLAVLTARKQILRSEDLMRVPAPLITGALVSTALFAISFAVVGHVAGLSTLAHMAISLHIAAIGLWLGSFYPLHTLCRVTANNGAPEAERRRAVQRLMHLFGRFGWGITGILVTAGAYLVTQVFVDSGTFFGSIYGRLLSVKIALVLCLLALAALNKFRLVGELQDFGTNRLRRSISGEMLLAFVVLLLTAMMTTFTGPAHLM